MQECSAERMLPEVKKGQVQEEELDSCRAAGERGPNPGGMRVQGETKGVSPCRDSGIETTERPRTNPGSSLAECLSSSLIIELFLQDLEGRRLGRRIRGGILG